MSWKLKEFLVQHRKESYLVTGKFDPMNLYAFVCPVGMNIGPIKPNPC